MQVELWDQYFAPRYGEPNAATLAAIRLLAEQEGVLLDPVYTGKAFAGLLNGLARGAFPERARCCFCTPVVPRHCSPIIHGHWA